MFSIIIAALIPEWVVKSKYTMKGQILIIDDVTSNDQWAVNVKDTDADSEQWWSSWMGDNLKTTTSTFGRISGYSLDAADGTTPVNAMV